MIVKKKKMLNSRDVFHLCLGPNCRYAKVTNMENDQINLRVYVCRGVTRVFDVRGKTIIFEAPPILIIKSY